MKHCPAGLDAGLTEYLAGKDALLLDAARDKVDPTSQDLLDFEREVKSATSTLRELLRARFSVNSSENFPSDGREKW